MSQNNQTILITCFGYFAVVFPDDAHIPQFAVGEPEVVTKVVKVSVV